MKMCRRFALAVWVMIAAALCFFENNTGTKTVLICSVLLPSVSILSARYVHKRISFSIEAEETCTEGEDVCFKCIFFAPLFSAFCVSVCRGRLITHPDANTKNVTVPLDQRINGYCVKDALPGTVCMQGYEVCVSDWFGLVEYKTPVNVAAKVYIQPALFDVDITVSDDRPSGTAGVLPVKRGSESEVMGIKLYAMGDPVHMIHWKLSARMDEMVLRDRGTQEQNEILLILEAARVGTDRTVLRENMRAFLSCAKELMNRNMPFSVYIWQEQEEVPVRLELTDKEQFSALRDTVLDTCIEMDGISLCECYASQYAGNEADHIAVFSVSEEANCVSLCSGNIVTLVLPQAYRGDTVA